MHNIYPLSYTLFAFFFTDTAPTEIYTLSLHDALPIYLRSDPELQVATSEYPDLRGRREHGPAIKICARSEEHTSELQSQSNLVCRLLLEKKKKKKYKHNTIQHKRHFEIS